MKSNFLQELFEDSIVFLSNTFILNVFIISSISELIAETFNIVLNYFFIIFKDYFGNKYSRKFNYDS